MSEWRSNANQYEHVVDLAFVEALPGWLVAKPFTCGHCKGEGYVVVHKPFGPFTTRMGRRPCPICLGSGVKP